MRRGEPGSERNARVALKPCQRATSRSSARCTAHCRPETRARCSQPSTPTRRSRTPSLGGESYRGHNGVVAWAERWRDALQGLELQTQNFVEAGEEVVVLSRFVARQRAGRESAEAHFAQVWTVKDGTVREVRLYLDWKAAMGAAGLRA